MEDGGHVVLIVLVALVVRPCRTGTELCSGGPEGGPPPRFKQTVPTLTTIQAGQTAYLTCEIFCVNNRSVSWVREKDSHILSVDGEVFIQDQRFSSLLKENNQWTLMIKFVTGEDAGKYECQVSTVPKLSRSLDLVVVVPKVRIFGGPAIYVREDSSVQLECVVSQAVNTPKYIVWEHNGQGRGGSTFTRLDSSTTTSTLTLTRVTRTQAGQYTCLPSLLQTASVDLFVLNQDGNPFPIGPDPHQSDRGSHACVGDLYLLLATNWLIFQQLH